MLWCSSGLILSFTHWISAKNPTQELRFSLNHPNFSLVPKISFKFRTLNQQNAQNFSLDIYIISH